MRIFKCDRCKEVSGDHAKPSGGLTMTSNLEPGDMGREMELCLECWNNLKMWAGGYNNAKPLDAKYSNFDG